MLTPRMAEALNKQINIEFQAFYSYLALSAWFEDQNLSGFASWFKAQGAEEKNIHAMKLFDYVNDRDGRVCLEAIPKPRSEFGNTADALDYAFQIEQNNTHSIHELYQLAQQEKDLSTASMLKWFIDEQVEEEKMVNEVRKLHRLAGEDRAALLVLNQQLGQRSTAGGEEAEAT